MDDEPSEPGAEAAFDELLILSGMKEGASPANLEGRDGLAGMILDELDLPGQLPPGRRLVLLHRVLTGVATQARGHALARFDAGEHSSFQVAAAGELLGLADEQARERVRRKYYQDDSAWDAKLKERDNRGPVRRRQLYASLWIGGQSPRNVLRVQDKLLRAFESAIKLYVAEQRKELHALAADGPEPFKRQEGQTSAQPESPTTPVTDTRPSQQAHRSSHEPLPRSVSRRTAALAVVLTVVISIVLTVIIMRPWGGAGDTSDKPTVNPSPVPAPASSPPVLVENVTGLQSVHGDLRFVLPQALDMTPEEFAKFNSDVTLKSRDFSPWYADHGAVPVAQGLATMTLRGNADEPVRIADINAIKECGKPFDGTFFVGYTQGSPEDNVKLGMDLDVPDPVLQEMVNTAQGLHPAGPDYFKIKTIELAPGEVETLTIGAFTKRYGCTFRLQLVVATSRGSFTQDIDYNGKPFKVTAMATPTKDDFSYSGYKTVYAQNSDLDWERVNPLTYEGY
jgi:hypothetical protein